MTSERHEVVIRAQVTPEQALALERMIESWNQLASMGASRFVAFYADGDGNFHPKATIEKPDGFPELTDEMREASRRWEVDTEDALWIDFDPIAWMLHD